MNHGEIWTPMGSVMDLHGGVRHMSNFHRANTADKETEPTDKGRCSMHRRASIVSSVPSMRSLSRNSHILPVTTDLSFIATTVHLQPAQAASACFHAIQTKPTISASPNTYIPPTKQSINMGPSTISRQRKGGSGHGAGCVVQKDSGHGAGCVVQKSDSGHGAGCVVQKSDSGHGAGCVVM
ncbi:hypothetical protein V494_03459 [Pseudogymnoascus sp. VKM F-4513 (FW-928)]|nr:hypothetical protein V494_03459 [Pseudogymnoascus sp. VKM F-4513 (FW-928)]